MRVTVLDHGRLRPEFATAEAVWNAIELAQLVEELGADAFWMTEHQVGEVGYSTPEMLIPIIAAATRTIRVGTGGNLLRYLNPLRLAQQFRVLQAVFPERVELGLARGRAHAEFQKHLPPERDYPELVASTLGFLRGTGPIAAQPIRLASPPVWILGSQSTSAELAARHGTPYCHALFFNAAAHDEDVAVIERYRRSFVRDPHGGGPEVGLAIAGLCAPDEAAVRRCLDEFGEGWRPEFSGPPEVCLPVIKERLERFRPDRLVILDLARRLEDRIWHWRNLLPALRALPALGSGAPPGAQAGAS
jgi:luciferase family oxidoreductase group 1